ncbi:XdhC protein (assists in molybdopterin insertion into xanthine dehydrogenase) [Rubellimicrobium mesophilum DSM 19309]|uniref:XdhC protein (Assists in molybdopterin insertion into xanthine dehydrogenase) n=1 Tax=Rubellimicrobium mesophilum DSM 19309 TaxID=442562 RepID=A0A017HKW2_9RHOB|nr:xanthine dehydrogenase accessory protein XdhC [Rubellimicrobium mesophilum]EYD74813.1 XdhC protein (assists in molybdopterin insertion into xanthine dehydrogenase) [Rubellimicrobium mesophilum DSM 19309]
MSLDLPALREAVARHGAVVRILVLSVAGSVPRDAGTSMIVWKDGEEGTIGGGELENQAVREARAMLGQPARLVLRSVPLGPALGQCCGGSVTLVLERIDATSLPGSLPFSRPLPGTTSPRPTADLRPGAPPLLRDGWLIEAAPEPGRPLWVWGAGHVGRAIVDVLAPWPGVAITWIDLGPDRFPGSAPPGVTLLPAAEPPALVRYAPRDADHLIVTRSHELDLQLCHALLLHGFASLGLIGSATKYARFRSRLTALGHTPAQIARIACPIGEPALGKHPQAIAVGVAAALIKSATSGQRQERDAIG